jgi:hypothetical protein
VLPEVLQILRDATPEAAKELVRIASDKDHKQQFAALESIMNRVLGMPKQPIGLSDDDDTANAVAGSLAQVMALLDRASGRGAPSGPEHDGVARDTPPEPDPA